MRALKPSLTRAVRSIMSSAARSARSGSSSCAAGAEQGKQGVADELVDEAAEPLHCRCHLREQLVLQRLDVFRIKPLAQGGKPAEIGKQHRHWPPVGLGGLSRIRRLQRCPMLSSPWRLMIVLASPCGAADGRAAFGAEGELRGTQIAASCAGRGLLRSAPRTEGEAALNLEAAT